MMSGSIWSESAYSIFPVDVEAHRALHKATPTPTRLSRPDLNASSLRADAPRVDRRIGAGSRS